MKRIIFSLSLALLLVLPIFLYLGWSLNSKVGWIIVAVLFGLMMSFPFLRHSPYILQITFLGMGFFTYLLVFSILKDLFEIIFFDLHSLWVFSSSILAVAFGSYIARRGPRVVKVVLPIQDLPDELENFSIAQISDLHIGPTIGKKYVAEVVKKTNALYPDLIALTGDIGDGPVIRYKEDTLPLGDLKAKFGVFFVPGNHEYYWGANEWMSAMNALGAVILVNRGKKIEVGKQKVLLAGVPDPISSVKPDAASPLIGCENASLKILLSHRPSLAQEASRLGYHLQLSGHTHGGQFFPWTIVVKLVHKYNRGHFKVNDLWLNVNVGTGSWGPLLRLGTVSEITHLVLVRLKPSSKSLE